MLWFNVGKYIKLGKKFICVFLYIFLLNCGPNTGNCLSPERSEIIGNPRDYNDYSALWGWMLPLLKLLLDVGRGQDVHASRQDRYAHLSHLHTW